MRVLYFLMILLVSYKPMAQSSMAAPDVQWKLNINSPIYASPVSDGSNIYFGALDGYFNAVNKTTGALEWKFATGGEIRSTALLSADKIYFVSGDGGVYCISKSGKLQWKYRGNEIKYDFADYHQSSPIQFSETLIVGMADGLYALSFDKGEVIWKFPTPAAVHSKPVADQSKIYVGDFAGNFYAVDGKSGRQIWKFKTVGHQYFPKGEVQGDPVLMNSTVVFGARDYNVYALDCEKGFAHWNKAYTKGWVLSHLVHDSILYMAGADERILTAVDTKSLHEKWKRSMELLVFGKPAFHGSILIIGTSIGKLHGIDKSTGKDVWTFATDGYSKKHLKYFKLDDTYRDDIYSIIKSNEEFLDAQVEVGGIFSSPLILDSNVYITSTDGTVYCLSVR